MYEANKMSEIKKKIFFTIKFAIEMARHLNTFKQETCNDNNNDNF